MRFQDTAACRSATGIPGRMAGGMAGGPSGAQGPEAATGNCPKAEAALRARESRPGIGEESPPPPQR